MLKWSSALRYVRELDAESVRILAANGIATVEDLLCHPPRSYEDRSNPLPINQVKPGVTATVVASVCSTFMRRSRSGAVFEAELLEGTRRLRCRWFDSDHLDKVVLPGLRLVVHGRVESDRSSGHLLMVRPGYQILDAEHDTELEVGLIAPVYETAGGGRLNSRFFRQLIHGLFKRVQPAADPLPPAVREPLKLPDRWDALQKLHFPCAGTDLDALNHFKTPEQFRLIFEELFLHQVCVLLKRRKRQNTRGISFPFSDAARHKTSALLPSGRTLAQKRVLQEIAADMLSPWPMSRLLQGDIGSGKVAVALQAAAIAIENGYQVALIAPSEHLAAQHYLNVGNLCRPLGYRVALLTGDATPPEQTEAKRGVRAGTTHMVIGAEALLHERLPFHALGLVIVDEQHGSGVVDRIRQMRRSPPPDVLVLTGTPIPRALALTGYGDLDLSVIDTLPPHRPPVVTRQVSQSRIGQIYELVRGQARAGRQAYIVYPAVEESEEADVARAIQMHRRIAHEVFPDLRVGLLHGRMTAEQKQAAVAGFKSGRWQVLVTTSVLEVGVNVPNATVMVVEQAERFPLAQLHQLRGRVGRAAEECYCVLVTSEPANQETRERVGVLVRTQDGFEVGEADVPLPALEKLSPPAHPPIPAFRIADLRRDRALLELARRAAEDFLDQAPRKEVSQLIRYMRECGSADCEQAVLSHSVQSAGGAALLRLPGKEKAGRRGSPGTLRSPA